MSELLIVLLAAALTCVIVGSTLMIGIGLDIRAGRTRSRAKSVAFVLLFVAGLGVFLGAIMVSGADGRARSKAARSFIPVQNP